MQEANTQALKPKQGELFILEDQKKFVFKQPLQKILGFCPMFNDTCVVVGIKSHRVELVAHYDKEGNILKEKVFNDSNLFPYVILSDREIAWVDNDRDCVPQWNLETDQYLEFDFKFENEAADSHQIFVFPETKLLCIAQWGRHDSNFFKLSYYNYPLTKDSQPVYEFDGNQKHGDLENVWNYEHTVRRANTKSMFTWFKSAQKQEVQFKSFELIPKENKQWEGKFVHHKVKNNFQAANGVCQLSVGNIWEMSPQRFLIVSITDRPHTETEYPNALFVYEADNKIFREAKFAFDGKFRFQYVHYYSFGTTGMIKSFDFIQGKALETPVYFIDNVNEAIAARGKWKCSHLSKYTLPAFDANMIIDAEYENGDVTEVRSRAIKVVDPMEITVELLEGAVKNIDEDLCREAAHLLKLERSQ